MVSGISLTFPIMLYKYAYGNNVGTLVYASPYLNTLVTSAHPDIVLMGEDKVTLIELTIPHNSMESLSNARKCKSEKDLYQQAISDREVKGIVSNLYTIEIGSLRHWLHTSKKALLIGAPLITKKMTRKIMDEAANKVIGASQVVFKGTN